MEFPDLEVVDPRLLALDFDAQEKDNRNNSDSFLDRINNMFGPLSGEAPAGNEIGPQRKKVKLTRRNITKQASSEHNSADEMPSHQM